MEKYLKAIFDLTKLPTKFFFLLSAVSGFILFIDQKLINEKLFLDNIKKDYGWIIGIIFVLSTGLVIVNFVIWIFKLIQRKILIKKWKTKFTERVKTLDRYEKAILREFILNDQKSIKMPIDNPSVAGLLDKKILVMNRPFGNHSIMTGMKTSLSINESVMEILELNDLDLSNPPTESEVMNAKNNRPEWINSYY